MNVKRRIFRFFQISCVSLFAVSGCSAERMPVEAPSLTPAIEFSFHIVKPESENEAAMTLAKDGKVPPGAMYSAFVGQPGGLILEKSTRINVGCVESASKGQHPVSKNPIVNFKLNEGCSKIFGEITSKNVGERFAVVLNGEILTAPTINSPITGGAAFIETPLGIDAEKLARDLNGAAKNKKAK